jgi:hypothetical protein
MLLRKKSVFSSLLKKLKIKVPSRVDLLEKTLSLPMYWDWKIGHGNHTLPYRSIPITMKDILKTKEYPLTYKLSLIWGVCIKPIFSRKISWYFGGSGNMQFCEFDWLTLKIKCHYSEWHCDTYQKEVYLEKYLWKNVWDSLPSKYFSHEFGDERELTHDEYEEKIEELERLAYDV